MTHWKVTTSKAWIGFKFFAASLLVAAIGGCAGCSSSGSNEEESSDFRSGDKGQIVTRIREQEKLQTQSMMLCREGSHLVSEGEGGLSLTLSRSVAHSGGRVFGRVEDHGETSVSYGPAPNVDQLLGTKWHPREFAKGVAFPAISIELGPHEGSPCFEVPLSPGWRPGIYRVWVEAEQRQQQGSPVVSRPFAYFQILSPQ